jgi:AraC family transcriptional regulator
MDHQRADRPSAFDAYLIDNAGTGPDYVVLDAKGSPIAAKWRRPASRSRLNKLGQNVLMYHIGGSTSVSIFIKGKCRGTGSQHGSIHFRPYHLELESVRSGVIEFLHVYLDQDIVNLYAQENLVGTTTVDIDPLFAIRDQWLQAYFAMLVSEFELYGGIDEQTHSLLLVQSQQLLIRHLVHWHSNAMPRSKRAPNNSGMPHPLSSRGLRIVLDYIEENLCSEIVLADLAALTGFSTNHFIRAFRAATQRTPYNYVIERRLLRVSEALRRSNRSLAEIALTAGFRNHSTLTNTFKRHHGVTPSAYRALIQ